MILRPIVRVASLAAATALVLMSRLARPWLLVRFGVLPTGRIGPLAVCPEIHLCEREAAADRLRVADLFYPEGLALSNGTVGPPANEQLLRMWKRVLRIHPFARDLARVSRRLPGGPSRVIDISEERDLQGVLAGRMPHLRFTGDERERADAGLRSLGLPSGARFVAFHARDPAYLEATYPGLAWGHHDYRDCDVATYVPAAREMTRRGLYAIRMGAVVDRPSDDPDPMVIDYAKSGGRSELVDVALAARCTFFLGNTAGLFFLPAVFRRRIALANYVPMIPPPMCSKDDLFIPKKIWSAARHRLLSFREMLQVPDSAAAYRSDDLRPIDSTPEEIRGLAVEMLERIDGTWRAADEDEELQARFRAFVASAAPVGPNLARIGARFLRENARLLD